MHSPNLRSWLRKMERDRFYRPPPLVFDGPAGLHVGWFEDDGWFTGTRLMRCLTKGAKAEVFAYVPKCVADFEEVPGFWAEYEKLGRCAIDPEHRIMFSDERWHEDGDQRTCLWCGHEQFRHRWEEVVQRSKWLSAQEDAPNPCNHTPSIKNTGMGEQP